LIGFEVQIKPMHIIAIAASDKLKYNGLRTRIIMLLFAHLGLTLAASRLVRGANPHYTMLGSMLPDIIDKPLGELLFGTPAMGRTFAHTLLFFFLISSAAYYWKDLRLASLAGGIFAHLFLDFMWNSPSTLFWPFLGPFPPAPYLTAMNYLQQLLEGLRNPLVGLPELLGLSYLIYSALPRGQVSTASI
jgi:membrane-bound metal-dependent hydrolase YbcI (DUF457 family)